MYDLLKSNGVNDDNIILLLIDDIQNSPKKPMKEDAHHAVGGKT